MQKERPILFSTAMVEALLAGRKFQTRRALKLKHLDLSKVGVIHPDGSGTGWVAWQPGKNITPEMTREQYPGEVGFKCPYGQVGDILWVKETFKYVDFAGEHDGFVYRASENGRSWEKEEGWTWKPSIHMPKEAARIWLEISDIRVERVQDISEEDAIAEGIWLDQSVSPAGYTVYGMPHWSTARECYKQLWYEIYGPGSWEENPFCWVIKFKTTNNPTP